MIFHTNRKSAGRSPLGFSIVCSMLQLSSSAMVRSLKFGDFIPPWDRKRSICPVADQTATATDLDVVHIDGGLDEVWTPPTNQIITSSTLHVLVSFVVSFTLSQPLEVETIKAQFEGLMNVECLERESFLSLQWTLWDQGELAAGKKYEFEVVAEIPASAPCSLEVDRGNIDYTFWVRFGGVSDRGQVREITKAVKVWNPYLVFDVPRPGLMCGDDMESEMVGTMIDVGKGLAAFIRYPDQWLTDQGFPLEISFPGASESILHTITKVKISIHQIHVFVVTLDEGKSRVTDRARISKSIRLKPSAERHLISLPFSPRILGRFTSPKFRIYHKLHLTFNRPWGRWKTTWEGDIEIFQPNPESSEEVPPEFGLMTPGPGAQAPEEVKLEPTGERTVEKEIQVIEDSPA